MERQPYKIIRGSLTRRDGPPITVKDDEGAKVGTRREHVFYAAKTDSNPEARDEVELTDEEARRFGLQRLRKVHRRNNRTEEVTPNLTETVEDESLVMQLIREGEEASGASEVREWRERVLAANLMDHVPKKKAGILEALREMA